MNYSVFYGAEGTPTDRVTSQNRLPACYLLGGWPPIGG